MSGTIFLAVKIEWCETALFVFVVLRYDQGLLYGAPLLVTHRLCKEVWHRLGNGIIEWSHLATRACAAI